jgi:hypothetical protein
VTAVDEEEAEAKAKDEHVDPTNSLESLKFICKCHSASNRDAFLDAMHLRKEVLVNTDLVEEVNSLRKSLEIARKETREELEALSRGESSSINKTRTVDLDALQKRVDNLS